MKHIKLTLMIAMAGSCLTTLPALADHGRGYERQGNGRAYLINHDRDHRYKDHRYKDHRRGEIYRPHPTSRPHITLSIGTGGRFDRFGHGYGGRPKAWHHGFREGYREGYRDAQRKQHRRPRRH